MATCESTGCDIEFGVFNHKYTCAICAKSFCDDHACRYDYLTQFGGLHLPSFEKVIQEKGYICQVCFDKSGLALAEYRRGTFERKCSHPECEVSFRNLINSKRSCVSCGKWYCRSHCKLERSDVSDAWLKEHTNFPLAEMVCTLCHEQKNANHSPLRVIDHPETPSLKLMAGSVDGAKTAIVVHGILSSFDAMADLCRALAFRGGFDSVWAYDDISYQGRVNEAKGFSLADIPVGFEGLVKALIASAGNKVLQVVNLPAYLVEGAARNLFLNLKLLNRSDVTIVGHSLGGVVSRCLVETYDVSPFVRSVVTLASPHALWLKTQKNSLKYWGSTPKKDIRYLAVLGKGDWVSRDFYSNYTEDDGQYANLVKVLIKGDHTSIHESPYGTYVPELIRGFLNGYQDFYVRVQDGKPYLRYLPLHGSSAESSVEFPSGKWLEFSPSA